MSQWALQAHNINGFSVQAFEEDEKKLLKKTLSSLGKEKMEEKTLGEAIQREIPLWWLDWKKTISQLKIG